MSVREVIRIIQIEKYMLSYIKPTPAIPVVKSLLAPLPAFLALFVIFKMYLYGSLFGFLGLIHIVYDYLPFTISLTMLLSGVLFFKICRFIDSDEAKADEVKTDKLLISFAGLFCATFYFGVIWLIVKFFVL